MQRTKKRLQPRKYAVRLESYSFSRQRRECIGSLRVRLPRIIKQDKLLVGAARKIMRQPHSVGYARALRIENDICVAMHGRDRSVAKVLYKLESSRFDPGSTQQGRRVCDKPLVAARVG